MGASRVSCRRCRPGYAPGGAPTFLPARESRQRKRPQVCDPCAALRGKPASRALRGALRNSLRACGASFRQPQRVSSRSGCILRCSRHPASPAPQAQPQGGIPHGPSLRSAPAFFPLSRLRERVGVRVLGPSAAMARIKHPSGRAEKRSGWGGHGQRSMPMLRALTCCGCLSGARQREVSSAAHPASLAPQVCPEAQHRGRRLGGAFFAYFLARARK